MVHLDIAHGVHRQNWLNSGLGEQNMFYLFLPRPVNLIIRLAVYDHSEGVRESGLRVRPFNTP